LVLEIAHARTPRDIEDIGVLFDEYAGLVAEALCFQNYGAERSGLPGEYGPPGGALLIARDGEVPAGCVALRRLDSASGEMKRMYVREAFRGTGLGRRLALAIVEQARSRNYGRIVLDTLPKLAPAIALYRDLGFRQTGPYLASPTPGALCFELRLS
jgi:GNAT superfamily N-acetyltransferase